MVQINPLRPRSVARYTLTALLCLVAVVGVFWISSLFLFAAFSSFADSPPTIAGGLMQLLIGVIPGTVGALTYRAGTRQGLGPLARASRTAVFSLLSAVFLVASVMVTAGVILWR